MNSLLLLAYCTHSLHQALPKYAGSSSVYSGCPIQPEGHLLVKLWDTNNYGVRLLSQLDHLPSCNTLCMSVYAPKRENSKEHTHCIPCRKMAGGHSLTSRLQSGFLRTLGSGPTRLVSEHSRWSGWSLRRPGKQRRHDHPAERLTMKAESVSYLLVSESVPMLDWGAQSPLHSRAHPFPNLQSNP